MTAAARTLPERLTTLYRDLDERLRPMQTATPADTATAITTAAVGLIPAVEQASIIEQRAGLIHTVTATNDSAARDDELQQHLANGPSIDALIHGIVYRTGDVVHSPRWTQFGPRADAVSVLSMPLPVDVNRAIVADGATALTLYSTHPDAFDDTTQLLATVVAAHTTLTLATATARTKTVNLERALTSSREIGMAMGVLMANHKITRDDAFTRLRVASQHTNRRLADIARDVTETGALEFSPTMAAPVPPGG